MSLEHSSLSHDERYPARTGSPSLTGRARSIGIRPVLRSQDGATSRTQSTDSRRDAEDEDVDGDDADSATDGILAADQAENASYEEALRALNPSNRLATRLSALRAVSRALPSYSSAALVDVLDTVNDLAQPQETSVARDAVFSFIEVAARTADVDEDAYRQLFETALRPAKHVDSTELQIKILAALLRRGPVNAFLQHCLLNYFNEMIRDQYVAVSEARRKSKGSERSRGALKQERNLHLLLSLISDTLRDLTLTIEPDDLIDIIRGTVYIAEKTTSKIDMKKAVEVLQAIIQRSAISDSELKSCVEILCAIANAIIDLKSLTWGCLMQLLSSPQKNDTVQILLDTLALAPKDRHSHTVCGALGVVVQLVSSSNKQFPKIEFRRFIDSLWGVHFASRRIRRDCLKTIRSLLSDHNLGKDIHNSPWDHMVQIILTAVGDETYIHDRTSDPLTIRQPSVSKESEGPNDAAETNGEIALADDIYEELTQLADIFNSHWLEMNPEQRELVGLFYFKLRLVLPVAQVESLLHQLDEKNYFLSGERDWQSHQIEMLRVFIWDRKMDTSLGCLIIRILTRAVAQAKANDFEHFHTLILRLLNDLEHQMTLPMANELATFARSVWKDWIPSNLPENLERFWPLLRLKADKNYYSVNSGSEFNVNEIVTPFICLFIDYCTSYGQQAGVMFDFLVRIAKSQELPPAACLAAASLLVRLRFDEAGDLIIIDDPDMLGLSGTGLLGESLGSDDHSFENEEGLIARNARSSTMSHSSQGTERSSLRVPKLAESSAKSTIPRPSWMLTAPFDSLKITGHRQSRLLLSSSMFPNAIQNLKLSEWLIATIEILQQRGEWEVYSYVIVHLPSQLAQPRLFADAIPHVKMLRSVISSQLLQDHLRDAPAESGVKKGDIAVCLCSALTMLLAYSGHFARTEQDNLVQVFEKGISAWERTSKTCVQAIAIACHLIPASVSRHLQYILNHFSKIISQSHLSVDILEFLGSLARMPSMNVNFREGEYRLVFAICIKYLEDARDQRVKLGATSPSAVDFNANRVSGISVRSTPSDPGHAMDIQRDLPQYVFALTHHVITVWFLSLRLADRPNHVGYLTSKLVSRDQHQNEVMDEHSQVTLDMMHRTAYLDLGETMPTVQFAPSDGRTLTKSWVVGMSIVTIETAVTTGLSQITKRQASGTTYSSYQQRTATLPPHHVDGPIEISSSLGSEHQVHIFPNHVLLQLISTIAPTPIPLEPICLPDDDIVRRALSTFDRNLTVDGYKAGVIYAASGQTEEAVILANTRGSAAYEAFLKGLGTKVRLKDASFSTQGLDRQDDSDGTHTYAWRDRLAELIFHVTTMMPTNLDADPSCVNKKRHIGNDFVKIIFNDSGLPFNIDTFSSQFNYVNIVITPEIEYSNSSATSVNAPAANDSSSTDPQSPPQPLFFTVHTVTNKQMPDISPTASFKLLTLASLPTLVRHIALHSAVFSNVWANREGGENVSSWRNRLREIVKLRERFAKTSANTNSKFTGARTAKTYHSGDTFKGRVGMGGLLEEGEGVASSLDFSRWAGPNHSGS